MNIREILGIAAGLAVGALVVAVPLIATRVSLGPTTPGTLDDCNKFGAGHVGGKATKVFRISITNLAALGSSNSFSIEEQNLDNNENPTGNSTTHTYNQAGDEPGNVTPLDLALYLESNSDPTHGKHKKVLIQITNNDATYPFRDDQFVIVPIGDDSEKMFCDYERSSTTSNVVKFRAHFKGGKKYGKYLIGVFTPYTTPASPPAAPKPIRVPIFIDPMVRNYG